MSLTIDEPETLTEAAFQTLVHQHDDSQDQRITGYFRSQALRLLMQYGPDPKNVIRVKGQRRANETSNPIPWFGYDAISQYVHANEKRREVATIDYDRADHGRFAWEELEGWLDENDLIHDIPVSEFVFRFEDSTFHEELWKFIQGACQRHTELTPLKDPGEFRQPFYVVLKSRAPGRQHVKRRIENFHPSRYFLPAHEETEDDERGMGWTQKRTMDFTELWSHRAFVRSNNVVAKTGEGRNLTLRDIEDAVVNGTTDESPEYGAVNSYFCFNRARQTFGKAHTDQKRYEWQEQEGWVQLDAGGGVNAD